MKLTHFEKVVGRALTLIAEAGLPSYGAYPTKGQYRGDPKSYAEAATAKAQVYAVALSETDVTPEAIEETARRYLLRKVLVASGDGGMVPVGEFPSAPAFAFAVRQTMMIMYMHLALEMPDRSVLMVRVPRNATEQEQRAILAERRAALGLPEIDRPALPEFDRKEEAESIMAEIAAEKRMRMLDEP